MEECNICGIRAKIAKTFPERAKGLIGKKDLPDGEGLLILHCNAIHTFFMRFPIDAIFLDKRNNVVKRVNNIRPWRFMVFGGFKADKVLEIQSADSSARNTSIEN